MNQGELIFGTDGVRDRAGEGLLSPESVARLARAAAWTLRELDTTDRRRILFGRDTRASGPGIARAMGEGLRRGGFTVIDAGILPTPGIAWLTAADPAAALGVVVSASHNPAEYNGIKFIASDGAKAGEELELRVSDAYWSGREIAASGPADRLPPALEDPTARRRYVESLVARCRHPERIRGRKIALDAAHGATYEAAPEVFRALGAEVILLGASPDGRNINRECGALHPEALARRVKESGADCGFSFDGDGDRMIPVTASGAILDGDHVLAIAARRLLLEGRLPRRTVVATVMSNLGLEKALAGAGIALERTAVGDRHVHRAMVEGDHPLGGEQSGHLIFLEDAQTGDGILAALRLLDCLNAPSQLEEESRTLTRYPQVLLNFKVPRKVPLEDLPRVQDAMQAAEAELRGDGRILLRYSGTEPLARVMIEGPEKGLIESLARRIGAAILASIPD